MQNIYDYPFDEITASPDEILRLIEKACRLNEYVDRLEKNFYQNIEEDLDNSVVKETSWEKIRKKTIKPANGINLSFFKANEGINEVKFITHKLIAYKNIWVNNEATKRAKTIEEARSQLTARSNAWTDSAAPYRLIIDDKDKENEEKLKNLGYEVKQGYSTYIMNIDHHPRGIMVYEMPISVFYYSDIIMQSLEQDRTILIKYILGGRYPAYELSLGKHYPIVGEERKMIQEMLIRKEDKIKEYYDNKIFKQNEKVRQIINERSLGES